MPRTKMLSQQNWTVSYITPNLSSRVMSYVDSSKSQTGISIFSAFFFLRIVFVIAIDRNHFNCETDLISASSTIRISVSNSYAVLNLQLLRIVRINWLATHNWIQRNVLFVRLNFQRSEFSAKAFKTQTKSVNECFSFLWQIEFYQMLRCTEFIAQYS